MRKIILLTLTLAGLLSLGLTNKTVKLEEAIELAEAFVKDNGYTNAVIKNPQKLSYELLDNRGSDVDSILNRRHNTLQSKAFCYSKHDNEWHIGFLSASINCDQLDSSKINGNLAGRAVIVNENGKEIRIAHKSPLFSYFTKIKPAK